MASRPTILFVGNDPRVKEFADATGAAGFVATIAKDDRAALTYLEETPGAPASIVFIVPDYWDSVGTFLETVKHDGRWRDIPIVYLGDVIEGNDQVFLKSQGVHTLTLGPVPPAEAIRYMLRVMEDGNAPEFDIMHPKVGGI